MPVRCAQSLRRELFAALALVFALAACGNPLPGEERATREGSADKAHGGDSPATELGDQLTPPFSVRGELDGLFLVWFDPQGPHTAKRRSEIPEARRGEVRVASLSVAPGQRLDPDHVYVADLSQPLADGSYRVRTHTRAWFDARIDAARPVEQASTATGVTIYKASWCGACRAAASYLRSRNVSFVEKDIEQDAEANAEMLRKARAAGKQPSGVPVIDFRGQIILGFDQATLARLIDRGQPI